MDEIFNLQVRLVAMDRVIAREGGTAVRLAARARVAHLLWVAIMKSE